MSDKATVQFSVTLAVTGPTEQHVTDYCILHLRDRGYNVTRPSTRRESVGHFIRRRGICYETLYRSLSRKDCPNVDVIRSDNNRILSIASNDDFDNFVTRNKNNGVQV